MLGVWELRTLGMVCCFFLKRLPYLHKGMRRSTAKMSTTQSHAVWWLQSSFRLWTQQVSSHWSIGLLKARFRTSIKSLEL